MTKDDLIKLFKDKCIIDNICTYDNNHYLLFKINTFTCRLRFGSDGWFGYVISLFNHNDEILSIHKISKQENALLQLMAISILDMSVSSIKNKQLKEIEDYIKRL